MSNKGGTFMLRKLLIGTMLSTALAAGYSAPSFADEVEVLHWWTSGGEAAALNVLKEDLQAQGIGWLDMPVAGGGGEGAMTVLRARVTAGSPPTAVQMLGFDILDWAAEGALGNLDEVAAAEGWDAVVPAALQGFAKYDGHWVSAPVNVHSTNWVWANKAILDELGLAQPTTWDEFVAAMQAAKDAGYVGLAHGGQPWQEATMFDSVVIGAGGTDLYKRAFMDLDPAALSSPEMVEAFTRMETLRAHIPVVYLDSSLQDGSPFVGTDNEQSIGLITDYLCRTGTPPSFFEMPAVNHNAAERSNAYVQAMERLGFQPEIVTVAGKPDWRFEEIAYAEALRVIDGAGFPTSTVLCANDRIAVGVMAAAFQRGPQRRLGALRNDSGRGGRLWPRHR